MVGRETLGSGNDPREFMTKVMECCNKTNFCNRRYPARGNFLEHSLCVSDREARADRSRRELIDRIAAGPLAGGS